MKRICALALALLMVLYLLVGCGSAEDSATAPTMQQDPSQPDEPTEDEDKVPDSDEPLKDPSEDNPMEDPAEDPMEDPDEDLDDNSEEDPDDDAANGASSNQQTEVKDYQYETHRDDALRISFKYPSHWINQPNKGTDENVIIYKQPTDEGVQGGYFSYTVKKNGDVVVTQDVGRDRLRNFSKALKNSLTNYKEGKGGRTKISKNTAFYFIYTAERNGIPIKGYAALAYAKGKRNTFYLFHFYCAQEDYKSFDKLRSTIIKSTKFL